MPIFLLAKMGDVKKFCMMWGDMDKFCLFNIDIGARAKTGKEEREGGGADTVV